MYVIIKIFVNKLEYLQIYSMSDANLCTNFEYNMICFCFIGNFTSDEHLNLIVAKNSRLEIYLVTPEGLRPIKEVAINGKIAVMKHFRPSVNMPIILFVFSV